MTSLQAVIETVVYLCLLATCMTYLEVRAAIVSGIPVVPYIVSGRQVAVFKHPYIASIQFKESGYWIHYCGGALIAPNKVLTAAHCLEGRRSADIRVEVGFLQLSFSPSRYKQALGVSSFAVHENYNNNTDNDLAVLNLSGNFVLNKAVQIATLAPKGASFAGVKCIITGWGLTSGNGDISRQLREVRITKITTADCAARWPGENITIKNICVYEDSAAPGSRPSACNGDSGGPMMCNGYLAGISSWTASNCTGNHPSVYIRVSEYHDWITKRL